MESHDIISILIAGYAAALSTYILFHGIYWNKPRLVFSHKIKIFEDSLISLSISVTNVGNKAVVVSECYLYSGNSGAKLPLHNENKDIAPGQSADFFIQLTDTNILLLRDVRVFHFALTTNKIITYDMSSTISDELNKNTDEKRKQLQLLALEDVFESLTSSIRESEKVLSKVRNNKSDDFK